MKKISRKLNIDHLKLFKMIGYTDKDTEELKKEPALKTKTEKKFGIKEHRREAIMEARIASDDSSYTEPSENQSSVDRLTADKSNKAVSLLKRVRSSNNET